MRACYVNHHIVSRGRDVASAARRMRGDATSSSSPRLRSVPSRTIYRVRYISLGRERALLLLHTSGLLYVRTHPCTPPGGCAPSSSFRYPLREIIRERMTKRTLVETFRWTVHYIGILSDVDRRASAGSDYHLGHFLSRRTIGD